MDSPSGISSNSSAALQNSGGSEEILDQRKRKRMISNRESARRSRLRKQKHLDGLTAQVAHLRKHNHQILTGLKATTQDYVNVESENVILRAQAAELSQRLHSLLEIISFLNDGYPPHQPPAGTSADDAGLTCFLNNSWNCLSQPVVMMAPPTDTGILF